MALMFINGPARRVLPSVKRQSLADESEDMNIQVLKDIPMFRHGLRPIVKSSLWTHRQAPEILARQYQ